MPRASTNDRHAAGSALVLCAFIVAGIAAIADVPAVLMAVIDPGSAGGSQLGISPDKISDYPRDYSGLGHAVSAAQLALRVQGLMLIGAAGLTVWGVVRLLRAHLAGRLIMVAGAALMVAALTWNASVLTSLADTINHAVGYSSLSYNWGIVWLAGFGLVPLAIVCNRPVTRAVTSAGKGSDEASGRLASLG